MSMQDPLGLSAFGRYCRVAIVATGFSAGIYLLPSYAQEPITMMESCPPAKVHSRRHHATHQHYHYDPYALGDQAAAATIDNHRVQQRNGEILDRTLWNHHFEKGKPDLRPSGLSLLHRMSRRIPPGVPMEVFVASAFDLPGDPPLIDGVEDPEADIPPLMFHANEAVKFRQTRESLDARRARSVLTYLNVVLKRPTVDIFIHDPAPTGLVAKEASEAYNHLIGGSVGYLPYGSIYGQPIGRAPNPIGPDGENPGVSIPIGP